MLCSVITGASMQGNRHRKKTDKNVPLTPSFVPSVFLWPDNSQVRLDPHIKTDYLLKKYSEKKEFIYAG